MYSFSAFENYSTMPTGSEFAFNGDFVIEDDFERAVSLLINSTQQQQQSKRRELGENIFSKVPQERLVEYFIALFKYTQENHKLTAYTIKNEIKLQHVVAQVVFYALKFNNLRISVLLFVDVSINVQQEKR